MRQYTFHWERVGESEFTKQGDFVAEVTMNDGRWVCTVKDLRGVRQEVTQTFDSSEAARDFGMNTILAWLP